LLAKRGGRPFEPASDDIAASREEREVREHAMLRSADHE
jgi:hypothetical protein